MRSFHFLIRSFAGAAALTTFVGCSNQVAPQPQPVTVVHRAPVAATSPDLGPPIPARNVESAPPSTIAEQVEPSPNELVKDARAALAAGELDRALKLARLAVVDAPGRSAAWNTLGRVQLRRGERAAALESFGQAVECNPASAWAHNNYGLALLYAGRYEESIDELEDATELLPSTGLMWNNLGMAYEHVDRLEDARASYRRAMALDHKGATENFVRLEGVRSLQHTAKLDAPRPDTQVDEDLPMIDRGL